MQKGRKGKTSPQGKILPNKRTIHLGKKGKSEMLRKKRIGGELIPHLRPTTLLFNPWPQANSFPRPRLQIKQKRRKECGKFFPPA